VILNGDTRLAANVIIDTWQYRSDIQTGTAGAVTIGGAGVSSLAAGRSLTIDTSTNTGGGYFDPDNIGVTALFTHNGGNVAIVAGNAGGAYVNTLVVNTSKGGTHNTAASNGTIALNTVGTEGSQTYTGGATTVSGSLTTNGGNIGLAGVASLALSGAAVTFDSDRIGGSNAAGSLLLGAHALNGALALIIDTTADGGGAGTDLTLTNIGNTAPLSSINVAARALTVGTGGVKASGDITLEARGASSDLTLNAPVTSTGGNIVLAAGQNFINNIGTTALSTANNRRWLVYSTNPTNNTFGGLLSGNQAIWGTTYPTAIVQTGNRYVFSANQTITYTSASNTKTYGGDLSTWLATAYTPTGMNTNTYGGVFTADTLPTIVSGDPSVTSTGAATTANAGSYAVNITQNTLQSLTGYTLAFSSTGALTVNPATLTYTANAANRLYGGTNPAFSGAIGGFVLEQNQAGATTGTISYTTTAVAASNVGSYNITGSGLTANNGNYIFAQAAGNASAFSINPLPIAEIITPPAGGILPAVVDAIIALPGGADLLPAFSSTVTVAATQIDAVAPPLVLANLQYVYVTTTTPGTLSGDIDTTVDGKAIPTKAQGSKSDGFNERLSDAPIQFTGTVLVRNGGIKLPGDADDSNERDKKRRNK